MARPQKAPGFFTGALVGALITAPFIAILYLARQVAGVPFVPFDVFDWIARTLPGPVITVGIDTMVRAIRAVGFGNISGVAKIAEQILAISALFLTGVLAGAVLFLVLRLGPSMSPRLGGLIAGALVGIPALIISLLVNQTATATPLVSGAWILVAFLVWGVTLGWAYIRLRGPLISDPEVAALTAVPIDRRTFMIRLGSNAAVITVVGATVGAWLAARRERDLAMSRGMAWSGRNALPNAGAAVEPVAGTRAELTAVADHYRIDINTQPPVVQEDDWRLRIGGMVDRPFEVRLDELRTRYEPLHQFVTLACISNPIGGSLTSTQRWTGVPLQRLLEEARLRDGATHLRITSVDGFHETLRVADAMADERIMVTYEWDGLPLPVGHGFPLRIYIPDRYGMKQPKWIQSIDAIGAAEPGYWVRRGWDAEARMNATSVIDTIGADMMIVEASSATRIPIGGIAHAGARGISRVELSVDGGPWEPAQLRAPLSETTWVIWRFEWPFQPGDHTFAVRCIDGAGNAQIEERRGVRPSGATGLHSKDIMM